ncbi:MAG: hypothetical protein HYU66_28235 [Armatimonadetes bacterium]|nr:hypothetical protein [Armatimonadota bacterium]
MALRRGLLLLVGAVEVWLVVGCGSSDSNGNPNGLSGTLDLATFTIPAGETREATADLTVRTTGDLTVDGTLLIDAGVSVVLLAEGALTVRGQIKPAPGAARAAIDTRQAAPNNDLVLSGKSIDLINTGGVQADAGGSVYLVGADEIKISGSMTGGDGADGVAGRRAGQTGGSVQIGTESAITKATAKGAQAPTAPAQVKVSGTLQGGNGGNGLDNTVGTVIGTELAVTGGDGGWGGNVEVVATTRIDLTGGTLRGGNGGAGGDAGGGANGPVLHAASGTKAGEKGQDMSALSGHGGDGGNVALEAPTKVNLAAAGGGNGGDAGSVAVASGNGGPGGDGGDTSIGTGWRGGRGLPIIVFATEPKSPEVWVSGGGNGGDSADAQRKGGKGGTLVLPASAPTDFAKFVVTDYGNGGDGFYGCTGGASAATDGGDVGTAQNLPARTAARLGNQQTRPTLTDSFNGGCGGDGRPAGKKGLTGPDDSGNVLGVDGLDGADCGAGNVPRKVDAVQLKKDFTGSDGTVWKAGTIIKLSRITGGIVERGPSCTIAANVEARHLHANDVDKGVVIDGKSTIKETQGDHDSCGYGLIVQVCVP